MVVKTVTHYTVQELALVEAPYLFGPLVNWALLGCLSLQVYTYSISSSRDRRGLKLLVYGVYLLDVAQTAFATYCAWVQLILGPHGFGSVEELIWAVSVLILFAGIVSFVVQCFFARRIWILKNTPAMHVVAVCIFVLAVVQCIFALASASLTFETAKLKANQTVEVPMIWLASSFLCDILISGSLFHILTGARAQTPFKAMESLLTRLSATAVQTGCITAVPAGLQLVAATLDKLPADNGGNQWYYFFTFVLGKLYSNMLLASLNARTVPVRVVDSEGSAGAVRTDEGIVFRVGLAGAGETVDGSGGTPATLSKEHADGSDVSSRV
ncbi:hypothetical protein PLICRDRAFT_42607 [Plicaturopsis crispa FD-325 SS-3]|nr:hypothetical protein PLICRDRAFT_42607 [Plicaturopsis crispa FD-325 SS-3]